MILIAVMLAFLPVVLDMTILHIAVPSLTLALQASSTQVLWIIDIYSLLMAGLLVPMGTLADRIGNRKLLLTGLGVFTIASVAAAFSVTPAMLIAGRILLAFGASMIMPCVLGIIRRTFEDPGERALALGLWGTVGAAGAAVGPLVGGALLEHFWWGSVFLINVPVMLIILPIIVFALPKTEILTPGAWLFSHALLLIVGIIAVVSAIKSGFGGKQPLWLAGFFLVAGLTALTVFVRKQLAMREPMLDLSLFARPAILAGIAMAVVASGALAGVELTLAQELQFVLDKTPLQAGLFMLPIMVAAAVGGPIAGYLSNKFGLRAVASLSMLTSAICLGLLAQADFHDPGAMAPALLALLGLALSIGLTASSIAIMGSVEAEKGGAAGSLEATAYELGAGLGITLFGVSLSATYAASVVVPSGIAAELAQQAAHSIGDTHVVAQMLGSEQAAALIAAGKAAFSGAHAFLLTVAAFSIGVLPVAVFLVLKGPGGDGRPRSGGTPTAMAVPNFDGDHLGPGGALAGFRLALFFQKRTSAMTNTTSEDRATKYPLSIRILHWLRALLVLGLIGCGWYMTGLPESDMDTSSFLYPNHKQFGVLAWLLALVHLALRWRYEASMPRVPLGLAPWEKWFSHVIHRLLIALTLLVPLLGYSLSSSFTQSDGVPFFFVPHIPELLPKNDAAFAVFQTLHKYAAYALLACIVLHVAGALKHRLQDKGGKTDVLPRML